MTTKVTVSTSDWPAEVTITDHACEGEAVSTKRVEPKSEAEFHITDTRSIGVHELAKPEAAAEPAGETDDGLVV